MYRNHQTDALLLNLAGLGLLTMTSRWILGVDPAPTQGGGAPRESKFLKHRTPTQHHLNADPQNLRWWLIRDRSWIRMVLPAPPQGIGPPQPQIFHTRNINIPRVCASSIIPVQSGWLTVASHHP